MDHQGAKRVQYYVGGVCVCVCPGIGLPPGPSFKSRCCVFYLCVISGCSLVSYFLPCASLPDPLQAPRGMGLPCCVADRQAVLNLSA
jgi:hypothetical protein